MAIKVKGQIVIDDNQNIISSGVATATNFKTGTSNVHNSGIEVSGINVLGADTPIGSNATIYDNGNATFAGNVTASAFIGDGSNLTGLFSGSYNDLTNKPSLFSGSYNDLSNKPTLATLGFSGATNANYITDNSQIGNGRNYITSADGGNAATLDGIDSGSFLRSDTSDSASGSISFTNSYYEFGNSTGSVSNDGGWNSRVNLAGSTHARLDVKSVSDGIITTMYSHTGHAAGRVGTTSNHRLILMCAGDERASLSTSGTLSTTQQGTLWGSSNDGSGSGLDADKLDGIDSSQFLRSDAGGTSTQRIKFQANATHNWDTIATGSGSQGSIEIYNSGAGTDAFMSFHVGGDYACYFGLDGGTNKLSVGGWSMGAASYEIYHAGNKPSLATLGFTGATNANYITDNGQIGNGAGYYSSGSTPTFTDVYVNNWIRNNQSGEGLYNQATGQHWYSDHDDYWNVAGGGSANAIRFRDDHASSIRGYVYANNSNQIGFLNSGGSWSLLVDNSGNVTATSDMTAYSDIRIKENIRTIDNALDKVTSMRGVYYNRKDSGKACVGVIAQEIEQVLPEVVNMQDTRTKENPDGLSDLKTVSYGNIVGLLIESIKELREEVETLKQERN